MTDTLHPSLTRPLPRYLAIPAIALVVAAYVMLARLWHGSWAATASASIAPAIVGIFAIGLWALERKRGPLPRAAAFALFVAFGAAAGGVAGALAPSLGSIRAGVLGGIFWGALIGAGWARPRLPAN